MIVKDNPYAVDFMDKASLLDIPDLARGAAITVGNDTGPSHMARLAGAKIVVLFPPYSTDAAEETPRFAKLTAESVYDISFDAVIAATERLLAT